MPRKKKIMDSVVFNNGGSKTMIKPDERAKIQRLVLDEHRPIREVARMLEISRNAIRRCVREDPSATFGRKSSNGKFLSEHQKDLAICNPCPKYYALRQIGVRKTSNSRKRFT